MWKYLAVPGLLVAGFGLGFVVRQFGGASPPSASGPAIEGQAPSTPPEITPLNVLARPLEQMEPVPPANRAAASTETATQSPSAETPAGIEEAEPQPTENSQEAKISHLRQEGQVRKALTLELQGATGERRRRILGELEALNRTLYASKSKGSSAETYTVKAGDSLSRIGHQYKLTPEFIKSLNSLKNDTIFIGQKLKVVQGPFRVEVDKSQFRLTVMLGDEAFKEYPIGLGVDGSTPVGQFKVQGKLKEPTWWHEGASYDFGSPQNPLGTRWITIQDGYGIHGTWDNASIGQEKSHGCVRMINKDVEELFDMLVTNHSTVTIQE